MLPRRYKLQHRGLSDGEATGSTHGGSAASSTSSSSPAVRAAPRLCRISVVTVQAIVVIVVVATRGQPLTACLLVLDHNLDKWKQGVSVGVCEGGMAARVGRTSLAEAVMMEERK